MSKNLLGYFPVNFNLINDIPIIHFSKFPLDLFNKPFFHPAFDNFRYHNNLENQLINFDLESHFIEELEALKPTGFIFHQSRCGSTLTSQMLAQSENIRVISEPKAFPGIFSLPMSKPKKIKMIKLWVNALAQKGKEEYFFIKFCSFCNVGINLIREAFPDVPILFQYREPTEIMAAVLENINQSWVIAKYDAPKKFASNIGVAIPELEKMSNEEYAARVLEKDILNFKPYLEKDKSLVINYNTLPGAFFNQIIPHFKLDLSPAEIEKMRFRTTYYSKSNNKKVYKSDVAEKTRKVTDVIKTQAEKRLTKHIAYLDKLQFSKTFFIKKS